MTSKNEPIELYLKQVKDAICNLANADEFIDSLYQQLYDFAEDNPDPSLADLIENFGMPEDIAKEFLADKKEMNPSHIAKGKKRNKIIIAVLVIAILAGGLYLYDLHQHTELKVTQTIIIHD